MRHPLTAEKNPAEIFSSVSFLPLRRETSCKKKPGDQVMDATTLETLECGKLEMKIFSKPAAAVLVIQYRRDNRAHRAAGGREATAGISTRTEKRLHPFLVMDLRETTTSFAFPWTSNTTHIPSLLEKAISIGRFKISKCGIFAGPAFSWLKPFSVWDYQQHHHHEPSFSWQQSGKTH